MARFRNIAQGQPLRHWWDNRQHQIAFARGDRAFIAINNELNTTFDAHLQTGFTSGTYCDIISGDAVGDTCSGKAVTVETDGRARIVIYPTESDSIIAILAGKLVV